MKFRFIHQSKPNHISTLDVIELYNCDDGYMPGDYTVADFDEYGDVMLVGMGDLCGYVAQLSLADPDAARLPGTNGSGVD